MSHTHTPRIVGGYSHHATFDPAKCPRDNPSLGGNCGIARCVDCCKQEKDRDVDECSKCGRQRSVPCYADEECL